MIRANRLRLIAFVGLIISSIALISPNQLFSQRAKLPSPSDLRESIEWGEYESYPTKDIIEKAPWLSYLDSKLIALAISETAFDAENFSKEFPSYFKEYNEAKNGFQRQRLISSIKEQFETRQHELLAIDDFVVGAYQKLGEYSFSDKGFSISSDFRISGIVLENKKDSDLFTDIIYIDENQAEKIIEANPSRRVIRFITVKPTHGSSAFLHLNVVPLYGIATSAIIVAAETGKVLAFSPFKPFKKVIKYPITGITANIGGSRGRTFVAMDIIVETTSEESRDEMVEKEYQIRDALIFYFRGRTLREIATREFQITARDTVRGIINSIIESEPVDTVFFTTFLIQ